MFYYYVQKWATDVRSSHTDSPGRRGLRRSCTGFKEEEEEKQNTEKSPKVQQPQASWKWSNRMASACASSTFLPPQEQAAIIYSTDTRW